MPGYFRIRSWHITREETSDGASLIALCGRRLTSKYPITSETMPTQATCETCLRVDKWLHEGDDE